MISSVGRVSAQRMNAWLPALFILLITAALFFLRRYDNNSLASWYIMFLCGGEPVRLFILLSAALVIASLLSFSRISFPVHLRPYVLFTAAAATALLCKSIPEVNIDASRYFEQAKYLEQYGISFFLKEWGRQIPAWTDLPAGPFLYGLIFRFFGEARIYTQLFTSLLFGMTTVLTWDIGRTLWDEDTGFIGGALLLGMPYLLMMVPLMLVDVPTMFFLMLSVSLILKALSSERTGWIVGASVTIAATLLYKYSALFLHSVLPLVTLINYMKHPDQRRRVLKNSFMILLFSLLLAGGAVLLKHDVAAEQIRLLRDYQGPGLGRWGENFISTFFFQISPIISIAALVSFVIAGTRRDLNYLIVAWLPCLILIFQIHRIRYALPAFPMVALMAAYGLTAIKNQRVLRASVSCAIAAALVLCFFTYIPYMKHLSSVNLQEAGAFLDTLDIDSAEVLPIPEQDYPINPAIAVPILDLFTRKRIIFDYAPGASSSYTDIRLSPYRFSWEYVNPSYYRTDAASTPEKTAVVLISGRTRDIVPPLLQERTREFSRSKTFAAFCPYYEYQTLVTVFW